MYTATQQDVDTINSMQGSWTAGLYPSLQQRPLQEVLNMRGGRRSVLRAPPPRPSPQLKVECNIIGCWFDHPDREY